MADLQKILLDKYDSKKHFDANETIFSEGEKIKGIYFIKNGRVKVTRSAKNSMAMWFANSLEFIGLSSFFNDSENYSFSTFAFGGEVDAVFIPAQDFKGLLDDYPTFKEEIIQILCDRINYTRERISSIKSQNIKKRFLNALLLLIDKEDKKAKVKIPYSVDELSELAGTSRQYIKKLIAEFQKKELLKVKGDTLIVDMKRLNTFVS